MESELGLTGGYSVYVVEPWGWFHPYIHVMVAGAVCALYPISDC